MLTIFFKTDLETSKTQLVLAVLLSAGHLVSPIILYAFNNQIRDHLKKQRANLNYEMITLFLAPILLMMLSWLIFETVADSDKFFVSIVSLLGALFFIFNAHHFAKQYHGITSMYLKDVDQAERKWILNIIKLVTFITPVILWLSSDIRTGFIKHFFQVPTFPSGIRETFVLLIMLVFFGLVIRSYKRGYLNAQLFLSYLSFSLIMLLICYSPLFFTLTISSASHWIQTIYLTSVQLSKRTLNEKTVPGASAINWILFFISIVGVSLGFSLFYRIVLSGKTTISSFGYINGSFAQLSFVSFFVAGMVFGVAFLHFYLERYIYRANPILKI